jgi:hypothetical protein
MNHKQIIRILDANINRSREGMRVAEEVVRFAADQRVLTVDFKRIRHALTAAQSALPVSYQQLLKSRDSTTDVGKDLSCPSVRSSSLEDIFIRNMKRSQEAVRVLEEFSKVVSVKASKKFQSLRFELYDFEKKAYLKLFAGER